MRSFVRRRPKLAVTLAVALALTIAGAAYAAWTWSQSTNTLQSRTGTITLSFATPTAADLAAISPCVPGGSCALTGEVTNPTSAPIQIVSYAASMTNGYGSSNCSAPNFTGGAESTTTTTISPAVTIPASATNYTITIPNALSLNSNAPTACQGQTITAQSGATIQLNFSAGS